MKKIYKFIDTYPSVILIFFLLILLCLSFIRISDEIKINKDYLRYEHCHQVLDKFHYVYYCRDLLED